MLIKIKTYVPVILCFKKYLIAKVEQYIFGDTNKALQTISTVRDLFKFLFDKATPVDSFRVKQSPEFYQSCSVSRHVSVSRHDFQSLGLEGPKSRPRLDTLNLFLQ